MTSSRNNTHERRARSHKPNLEEIELIHHQRGVNSTTASSPTTAREDHRVRRMFLFIYFLLFSFVEQGTYQSAATVEPSSPALARRIPKPVVPQLRALRPALTRCTHQAINQRSAATEKAHAKTCALRQHGIHEFSSSAGCVGASAMSPLSCRALMRAVCSPRSCVPCVVIGHVLCVCAVPLSHTQHFAQSTWAFNRELLLAKLRGVSQTGM